LKVLEDDGERRAEGGNFRSDEVTVRAQGKKAKGAEYRATRKTIATPSAVQQGRGASTADDKQRAGKDELLRKSKGERGKTSRRGEKVTGHHYLATEVGVTRLKRMKKTRQVELGQTGDF